MQVDGFLQAFDELLVIHPLTTAHALFATGDAAMKIISKKLGQLLQALSGGFHALASGIHGMRGIVAFFRRQADQQFILADGHAHILWGDADDGWHKV